MTPRPARGRRSTTTWNGLPVRCSPSRPSRPTACPSSATTPSRRSRPTPPRLSVGVGTVATSRQLRANELVDQYRDASVVCAVTAAGGYPAVREAAADRRYQDRRGARCAARRGCRRVARLVGLGPARATGRRPAPAEAAARVHLRHHRPRPRRRGALDAGVAAAAPTTTSLPSPRSRRSPPVPTSSSGRCSTTPR